ncbi:TetR family transcriptional regulator [Nocardioides sp. Root1257]|uniref:TetR/AcrR family transcriptional regulator n=1 Tax=unclassified Nocardioides TaxID=2615069 RepID=UPI0006FE4829|nr:MULTISPECIES: TetR/AcrR family transcriptional regulator [unclassified Nocardioides]KQW52933.1 TetR family transcriptional regulator [Nocardioides sp. Root1257]KRC55621.1 TetR family transcriptional regulator [Nocardioides sp. Root224]
MAQPTVERVQAAALALFAERGYHGTGIRQLADAAGLSSASLYHYMGTKEELLVAIMRGSLTELLDAAEAAATLADPQARLVALVELHVRTHASAPERTRVVDDEVNALSTAARDEVVGLRDRYEGLWQDTLDEGVATGAFEVGSTAVVRRALLEMCSGVARWWTPAGDLDPDALAAEYAGLALRLVGVSARHAAPR